MEGQAVNSGDPDESEALSEARSEEEKLARSIEKPGQEIPGDFASQGTKMREADSLDRLIDGMKNAAEGARVLSTYQEGKQWRTFADLFDKLRLTFVQKSGRDLASDRAPTRVVTDRHGARMSRIEAYERLQKGLSEASATCHQIATVHRGDAAWTLAAWQLTTLRDKASELVRKRTLTSDLLHTPYN